MAIRRDDPDGPGARELERLEHGETCYREVMRLPPTWYLNRDLYVRLDPAFSGDLWQGQLGYRLYVATVPR